MINRQRVPMNSKEQQTAISSNSEQSSTQTKIPNQTPDVRVPLYCFKPPFPSDGGFAAASAGRGKTSPFLLTNLARSIRFD
jgi:hypothetical protein